MQVSFTILSSLFVFKVSEGYVPLDLLAIKNIITLIYVHIRLCLFCTILAKKWGCLKVID